MAQARTIIIPASDVRIGDNVSGSAKGARKVRLVNRAGKRTVLVFANGEKVVMAHGTATVVTR